MTLDHTGKIAIKHADVVFKMKHAFIQMEHVYWDVIEDILDTYAIHVSNWKLEINLMIFFLFASFEIQLNWMSIYICFCSLSEWVKYLFWMLTNIYCVIDETESWKHLYMIHLSSTWVLERTNKRQNIQRCSFKSLLDYK